MKKIVFLACLCIWMWTGSQAQFTRFIIRFKNKGATSFTLANPSPYLSARAIERRTRYNITIDSTDLPVPLSYVNQVKAIPGVTVLNTSRWLNAISIDTTDPGALAAINALPFVQSTSVIAAKTGITAGGKNKFNDEIQPLPPNPVHGRLQGTQGDFFNYGASSYNEIRLHKGEFLHNIGLRGQGMQIAMLDGGFFSYTTLDAMDSIMANNQVLSTWDFVNREASVVEDNSHGMMCLSTIAANIPGQFVGKAPKANFHLFKTEDVASEYPIEEFNWVCGAERSDSSGADVISSSVGYNTFNNNLGNYSYNDMNGNTAMCTIGADLAAKKGLIVFQSAGNEGAGGWHYLIAPADGDSVVAVGAVNAAGTLWNGSSFGPSSDGQIKPDMASVGLNAVVQGVLNTIGVNTGTSFSCPNMAGLGTCLWQGFPEFNNMRIIRALREAGSKASAPDDRVGYGIPDMKAAFTSLLIEYATSNASVSSCTVTLNWNSKDVDAMKYEIQRKAPGDADYVKIADVNPQAGSILANRSYQFTNTLTNVAAGTISYRIRQIIDTATATFAAAFIDTANVTIPVACTTTSTNDPDPNADKITVQPNPASSNAVLVIQTRNAIVNMPVSIYDMKGRLILQLKKSKGPGKATIDLPVNKLSKGKYIIAVYDNQKLIGSADLLKL
ncbi:MAG: S8 family peptidase [Chitinophagaceae bacterium]|nr:S8 family peptidase [Chitinophagaceae bacterium]